MKLNNKGFAISTVMYMILVVGVVLIILTLSMVSSRRFVLDKIMKEAENNIYNVYPITYRQALNIITDEAIAFATNNNINNARILITVFTSIDSEILTSYKLNDKTVTVSKENGIYNIVINN